MRTGSVMTLACLAFGEQGLPFYMPGEIGWRPCRAHVRSKLVSFIMLFFGIMLTPPLSLVILVIVWLSLKEGKSDSCAHLCRDQLTKGDSIDLCFLVLRSGK